MIGRLPQLFFALLAGLAPAADALSQSGGEQIRPVPGSPTVAKTWLERDASGAASEWYAVSLDGLNFHEARAVLPEIALRHGAFDPLRQVPPVVSGLQADAGNRLYIVQYWTQSLDAYRQLLHAYGATPRFYLPHNAFVVEMDAGQARAVAALPFVRWVGPFHPAYKLEETLLQEHLQGFSPQAEQRVNLLTVERGPESHQRVGELIRALGGRVESEPDGSFLMSATLTRAQIAAVARLDAVQWIDRWSAPQDDMDIARNFHGANYVQSAGGYTGTGVRVEVLDGGCDTTHPDLVNFVLHGTNTASAHGTCTSGIVCGSGAGNAAARGAMPSATLIIGDYSFFSGGSRYNHSVELQNPALTYKAVLQSNSWGSSQTTSYTSASQDMDLILFDNPRLSILQSQSNLGNQNSRPEAWAKNIISVGGINHFNTETKSDDSWGGASIGPAADGRIKPDVASFYDATLCTDQVGSSGYTSTNYYSSFGGTSGATPITAGHLGLLYQMWSAGVFGTATTPGASVFDNRPQNTTAKALLINTATQWTFSGTTHNLTRTHQGWGHADLRTAWDLRTQMYIVDETDVLTELDSTVHSLNVAAGTPALKATMVYRDYPGTTSSTQHRINDLNLKVTAPGGTIYWGNNGLSAAMWSTSGGVANTKDTVENVFVQNPAAGTWLVEVIAQDLNADTHVETGGVDADYALVVSGVTAGPPPPPPAAPSGLTATAVSSSQINLAWTDNANNEDSFEIERSLDGVNFAPRASVGANVTTFSDTGLSASTTYYYRVRAVNGGGASAWSNTASATTQGTTGPVDDFANADLPVTGSVTNTYTATHSSDNFRQRIQEITSSGSPASTRYSYLEHKWTINVTGGGTVTFFLEAHHNTTSDGEDFVFAYSTDNVNFTNMVTVTKTSDNNAYQTYALPSGLSGTVYIRVRDVDQTPGNRAQTRIFIDHMFIRSQ